MNEWFLVYEVFEDGHRELMGMFFTFEDAYEWMLWQWSKAIGADPWANFVIEVE
ncbi:MAG: hypothetical protein AB7V06_25605 [Candidatus Obscuribacterales bacterium]